MNSPSAESRLAAYDVPLAIVLGIVSLFVSRLLKTTFTTPDGNGWLWICAGVGLATAYGLSIKRGFSAFYWIAWFAATYLSLQIITQVLHGYGVI